MTETTLATQTPNLNKALSQLQGELPKVSKAQEGKVEGQSKESGKSYSYSYKYADLADVTAAVGPLLAKHGLSFFAAPTIDPASRNQMILAWSLLHESGEERSGEWPLGPVNQKPQALGSMVTYARRYCLGAATGIVAEDDDDGQQAQRDHGSRQSAGDVFDQSTPAPPRQNGNARQRGQASGPPGESTPYPSTADAVDVNAIDEDAQTFADKAHKATTPAQIEGIHKRAREEGKVASLIRNPASGGVGKLAVYLDWKRKQLMAAKPAALDPDDPWAAKVEEIPEGDDIAAADVLEEAAGMLGRDEIDAEHYARIEAAVAAKFPDANKAAAAAA